MTDPVFDEPARLPLFTGGSGVNGHTRPGRVRSTFRLAPATEQQAAPPAFLVPAEGLPAGLRPVARPPSGLDWAEVARFRRDASAALTEAIGKQPGMAKAEQEELGRSIIASLLATDDAVSVAERGQARTLPETRGLADAVFDALFRLGRLQPLLDDPAVENVIVTGYDRVVVELADGSLVEAEPVADSDEELLDFLSFLASRSENPRPFSPSQPSLHLRLEDGSRLAAARDTARPSVVIRRHRVRRVTLDELVEWGTLSPTMANLLAAAVRSRHSMVVSAVRATGRRPWCVRCAPRSTRGKRSARSRPSTSCSSTSCPSSTGSCTPGRSVRGRGSGPGTGVRPVSAGRRSR